MLKKLPLVPSAPHLPPRQGSTTRLHPLNGAKKGSPEPVTEGSIIGLVREYDLSHLHPAFRDQLLALLARFRDELIPFILYEGFRSQNRQAYLYAQGRTRAGEKVTSTKPGDSLHQFGLAADLVLVLDGVAVWERTNEVEQYWDALSILAPAYSLNLTPEETNGVAHVECTFAELSDLKRGLLPSANGEEGKTWWDNLAFYNR